MWETLAVVAALATAVQGGQLYATAPQARGQYHRGGSAGSYHYGYNTGDGVAKVEVKRPDGSVVGSYRYFDPTGKQIVRSYIADSKGFRVLGNDLPISPETPAAAILGAHALTAPVEGAAAEVVDAALHPSARQNTISLEDLTTGPLNSFYVQQATALERQNDIYQNQQRVIEQQREELASLRSQLNNPGNVVRTSRQDVALQETNLFSNLDFNLGQRDTNYYNYPYEYIYDFPAGFAYTGGVVTVREEPTAVIGVRKVEHERNFITAGLRHTPPQRRSFVIGRAR